MKLQNQQRLTPQQTSEDAYLTQVAISRMGGPTTRAYFIGDDLVFAPNPPTEEAVKRAQFVDKTYQWQGR